MTADELKELLLKPEGVYKLSFEQLEHLLIEYPYYQGVRMLLLKKYKSQQEDVFERHLALGATYAVNRSKLFDFFNNSKLVENIAVPEHNPKEESSNEDENSVVEKKNNEIKEFDSEEPVEVSSEEVLESEDSIDGNASDVVNNHLYSEAIEEWLMDFEPPRMKEKVETDRNRNFRLPRIPVLNKGMLDFLDETSEETVADKQYAEPVVEKDLTLIPNEDDLGAVGDLNLEETPKSQAGRNITKPKEGIESFDFFSEQTDAFLRSLADKGQRKDEKKGSISFNEDSLEDNEEVVSETLANLLARQGQHVKAIKMYEALILKFPEKNRYFARKIEDLQ